MEIWTDDPEGLYTNVAVKNEVDIGTALNPLGTLYANTVQAANIVDSAVVTAPAFNLLDGSDKNHSIGPVYGTGTAYVLTTTPAAVVQGTTSPSLVLNKAGTYLITGVLNLQFIGATFAASRNVVVQFNRTNNTPAVLTGSAIGIETGITSTVTGTFQVVQILPVIVTTANVDDIIKIFASVAVAPTAGDLKAVGGAITAIRLY